MLVIHQIHFFARVRGRYFRVPSDTIYLCVLRMADPTELDPYEDVNQAVSEDWVAETTPYERIREVISRVYTAIDAQTVADRAATSPKTARKHLATLADDGFITTVTGPNGATLYRQSAESLVVEQTADILSQVSTEELQEQISEMRDQIAAFRQEYGVESPAESTVDRTNCSPDPNALTSLTSNPSANGKPRDATSRSQTLLCRSQTPRNLSTLTSGRTPNLQ